MNIELNNSLHKSVFFIFFITTCMLWVFSGLVGHAPWKPDEAYSFGMILHYIEGGNWIIPKIADIPFMEKPPFFYILASYFAQIFHPWLEYHDGARLTNGFFLILTLWLLGLTYKEFHLKKWSDSYIPYITILLFISSLGLVYRVHLIITDVALLTGFSLSLYALSLFRKKIVFASFILGTGVGLGFMSKGILAPGIIGSICLSLLIHQSFRDKRYIKFLFLALFCSSPWLLIWPVELYNQSQKLFWLWFWDNNFARFLGATDLGPQADKAFYYKILLWYAFPILPLTLIYLWKSAGNLNCRNLCFVLTFLFSILTIISDYYKFYSLPFVFLLLIMTYLLQDKGDRFIIPIHFFAITLLILSLSSTARELYALPMLLPLSLMAGEYFLNNWRLFDQFINNVGLLFFSVLILFLWLIWLALIWPDFPYLGVYLQHKQPGFIYEFSYFSIGIAFFSSLLWLFVIRLNYFTLKPVIVFSYGITAIWCLLSSVLLPYLDFGMSYKGMLQSMNQKIPTHYNCISSYRLVEAYPSLVHYYIGEKMHELTGPTSKKNCNLLLIDDDDSILLSPGWEKLWSGSRSGDTRLFSLYQKENSNAHLKF